MMTYHNQTRYLATRARTLTKTSKVTCVLAVCLCFCAEPLHATVIESPFFFEDFEDNDLQDGVPVAWVSPANVSFSHVEMSSGTMQVSARGGNEVLRAGAHAYGDVILRAQVSLEDWHAGGDFVGIFARGTNSDCETRCGAYWAGIRADGVIASGTNIDGTPVAKGWTQTGLNAKARDVLLELELEGRAVRFRAWQEGQERPSRPQQTFADRTFTSGYVGTLSIGVGDSTSAYRFFQALPTLPGDFSGNGQLDVADVDILSQHIAAETNDVSHDLTGDGLVDGADLDYWVNDMKATWYGDANLDGEFNSGDFVTVFQAGRFETGTLATWADGDWNADRLFNSADFVVAFQDGGYEAGVRAAIQAVPEPSSTVLLVLGGLGLVRLQTHRRIRRTRLSCV